VTMQHQTRTLNGKIFILLREHNPDCGALHKLASCDSLAPSSALDAAQRTIDNFLDSDIIVSISSASLRNRALRLTSRWRVKCMHQRVAVVPAMLSPAQIKM
jgi:hypothetical protein